MLLLLATGLGRLISTERLLYLSGKIIQSKLYALDIHRGLSHKLSDKDLETYQPSPDGQQILYMQPINDHAFAIFAVNLVGGDEHQLVQLPSFSPDWSPDSQSVAFVMYDESSLSMQIHTMNRDGSNLKMLTNLPTGQSPFAPLWSPDGTRIIFQATARNNQLNTYVMNADGSELQRLSFPDVDGLEVLASTPQWSVDSRYMAFAGQLYDDQNQPSDTSLCLLELNTDDLRCLDADIFFEFALSPDSQYVAYISSGWSGIFNLELLNIETEETQRILRYSEITPLQINGLYFPMWTSDGTALVYELSISGRRDDSQLYIINADGTGERRLTNAIGGAHSAAWWPND